MSRRTNAHDFPTNRDRDAFGEVLNRSNLSYAKGQFWRLEFVSNPIESECINCRCGHANVRLVWRYGKGFGSDEYCLSCFFEEVRNWMDSMIDDIKESHHEYRVNQ